MNLDNNYVTIDLDAISRNIDAVKAKSQAAVMAVVKADAYGHGAVSVARSLADKCAFFGVSSLAEGRELRRAGIENPILILGPTPKERFALLAEKNIRPTVFRWEDALALSQAAQELRIEVPFHIAVDTGMSRIGMQPTRESAALCVKMAALPGIRAEGLFSHFATADHADLTRARAQAALFAEFDAMLKALGLEIPIRHLDNSAGLMNFPCEYEMVRSGIVTYGLYPSREVPPENLSLTPALQWHSRISNLQLHPAGREIGYGGAYVTDKPTLVATVPVGYADGYRRSLSGNFYVLIRGKKAPILGKVCMDQMMVDVTGIPETALGDDVVLIGDSGKERITAEALAEAAGSFNYELVCGISRRVPREYLHGGTHSHRIHYLLNTNL